MFQMNTSKGIQMQRKKQQGTKKRCMQRLCWEGTPSPAAFLEQAFEILSPCSYKRLTVHAPEPSQPTMPATSSAYLI